MLISVLFFCYNSTYKHASCSLQESLQVRVNKTHDRLSDESAKVKRVPRTKTQSVNTSDNGITIAQKRIN